MSKYLAILVFFISQNAFGAPDLIGTWKSSLELSNEFNNTNAKLEEKQRNFINQIFGHVILIYDKNKFKVIDKERTVVVNGEKRKWEGSNREYKYKLITSDDNKIVIKEEKYDGGWKLETLHFIDEDTYWIYMGSTKEFEHLNIREYFVRVK